MVLFLKSDPLEVTVSPGPKSAKSRLVHQKASVNYSSDEKEDSSEGDDDFMGKLLKIYCTLIHFFGADL